MPTYDYACPDCGGFDAFRSLAQRNEPCACPDCGVASPRVWVTAPRLACLGSDTRAAMAINERARHEPGRSSDLAQGETGRYGRLQHPAGCGCCAMAKRTTTVTGANGAKGFPSKRPWMISH